MKHTGFRQPRFQHQRCSQALRGTSQNNPEADFSLSTPFSILTKDEFATRINNPIAQGNGTLSRMRARSLRGQYDFTTAAKMNRIVMSSADETEGCTLGDSQAAAKPVATAMSFIWRCADPSTNSQRWPPHLLPLNKRPRRKAELSTGPLKRACPRSRTKDSAGTDGRSPSSPRWSPCSASLAARSPSASTQSSSS